MRVLEIEVVKWTKHNARTDAKHCSWFKMSNSFFNDPEFYGASHSCRLAWMFILCTASQQMSPVIKLNTKMIADSLNFDISSIDSALSDLIEIGCIRDCSFLMIPSCSLNSMSDDVSVPKIREDKRRKDKKREDKNNTKHVEKNLPEINSKAKRKTLEKSPLAFLFEPTDEIQVWLLTGTEAVQRELLSKFSPHVLVEEIKKAYFWQLEKQPRLSGTFLLTWMSNRKTSGYGSNSNKVTISEENPTGNPHYQKLMELRRNQNLSETESA